MALINTKHEFHRYSVIESSPVLRQSVTMCKRLTFILSLRLSVSWRGCLNMRVNNVRHAGQLVPHWVARNDNGRYTFSTYIL